MKLLLLEITLPDLMAIVGLIENVELKPDLDHHRVALAEKLIVQAAIQTSFDQVDAAIDESVRYWGGGKSAGAEGNEGGEED